MCGRCVELSLHRTAQGQKGRKSRSQGQMKIVYNIIKYLPKTSSDGGNIPVLYEIDVAGANSGVQFLIGSS